MWSEPAVVQCFRPDAEGNVHLLPTSKPYGISGIENFTEQDLLFDTDVSYKS